MTIVGRKSIVKEMRKIPSVSIIFPTFNGWEDTKRCLESIAKLDYPKERLEVIIVDNGSSVAELLNYQLSINNYQLIRNKKNLGFAMAVNQGIKKSKGRYILVTNNDAVFGSNSVSQLINYLVNNPDTGVVGPEGLNYNFWLGRFKSLKKSKKTVEADWIAGHAMLFPKSLWTRLNGFDEDFFFTGEDADFCIRVKKIGLRSVQIPKVDLKHKDGSTINKPENLKLKYYEGYKSKFRLLLKHANLFQIFFSFFLQIFVYTPYRSFVLREKSTIAMLKAIWTLRKY